MLALLQVRHASAHFSQIRARAMTKIALLLTLIVTVFVWLLPAVPAQAAGAARTFVSAAGSDGNNCTNVATPCRHLAAAYAATAANGEIYVLDPANYGSLTITGPLSIEGHGWASIAPVSGNAAITINANPGDKINIIGVVLDGTAIASTKGIVFNSGGTLNVRDSVARNFTFSGLNFGQTASTQSHLNVTNTLVSDNNAGIVINPAGSGTTTAVLEYVEMEHNAADGLSVQTSTQLIKITVSDSVSTNNQHDGILVNSTGGTINVTVRDSTIANNASSGLEALNTGATIRVTRSTIAGNGSGWADTAPGVVLSYADNNIDGNASVNTEPPGPLAYK
jgi:hypothetical protein